MTVTVHQALHGYSDGHRLIASSLPLSGADARVMVVMSDLSGAGVKPEQSGYLTGYPLEGAGKYVIAKTWAAPEMYRPGCVWTHSLIIDNADLAALTWIEELLSAFKRPRDLRSGVEYSSPLAISPPTEVTLALFDRRTPGILEALYTHPEQVVLTDAASGDDDERLVTAIWMQQWPRLRRSFGFCTLAGIDRAAKGTKLDLQLVRPSDRQNRSKFPNSINAEDTLRAGELKALVDDIEGHDDTKVREFLRRTGGDVDGGRRAMRPLCRLHDALFVGRRADLKAAVAALADLDALGSNQARSVRILVAREAIEQIDGISDEVLDFVIETLEQGTRFHEKPISSGLLGPALWHRSPVRFFEAIDALGVVGAAASDALAVIPAAELVGGLKREPDLARRVVQSRPELMEMSDFWAVPAIDDGIAEDANEGSFGEVAKALLEAGRAGPARLVFARTTPEELVGALNASAGSPVISNWVAVMASDPLKTAAALASGRIAQRSMVARIAYSSDVDTIPNDYGEDPWLIASRSASGDLTSQEEDFLAAFLMSRALGYRSRSVAELIRMSYTTLYRAFQYSRLPGDVARMVTSRLDWGIWSSWDNCSRLRETVVARFVDRGLDPETFGRLTDDGALAKSLFEEAAKTGRGRRYLNEVRKRLRDAQEKGIRARADHIAGMIK